MANKKAIIFDIDGTLTPQTSWIAFTRDCGASVDEHLAIYHDTVDGKIGLDESKSKLLKMWQATGKTSKDHVKKMFANWPIRPEAKLVVDQFKSQGLLICLITGSVGIYAQHIAQELGIANYYANAELYFDNNKQLIDFHYTTDQANVKLAHLNDFCVKNNLQLQDCIPVGDSNNDIEIFRQTGNGVLLINKETLL